MRIYSSAVVLAVCAFLIFDSGFKKEKITYSDLVERLIDLEHLALLPSDSVKQTQVQVVNTTEVSGGEEQTFPQKEGDKYVLAEMKGPGVLTRIWAVAPLDGRIMIYLDDAETPVLDHSFSELYRLWGRKFENLAYSAGRSLNLMIPIPYQKSCRIVAGENWGEVCQFTFTTFLKNVELPVFQPQFNARDLQALERINQVLGQGQPLHVDRNGIQTESKNITVDPGKTVTVFQVNGSRAITSMKASPRIGKLIPRVLLRGGEIQPGGPMGKVREITDPGDRDVLRELLLSVYWDGEKEPAIMVPLGDFFGSAPGWNAFRTFPAGATSEELYSYWFMPFKNGARIEIRNDGKKARTLDFEIGHAPLNKPADHYGRLHVKWRREKQLPDNEWTALETTGEGKFIGSVIDIYNPLGKWWGDCDYTFLVDNEKTPSIAGSGLDAYFGTWANNWFSEAFHAHTIIDRSMTHREHESLNRWHIADPVPFNKSLKINFRRLFPPADSVVYTTTMFWYLAEGQSDRYTQMPLNHRLDYPRTLDNFGVTNCIEGEDMDVIEISGGEVTSLEIEGLHTGGWSGMRGKQQLWWRNIRAGDSLKLGVYVDKAADYKIQIQFIRGPQYGNFRISLDGDPIGNVMDFNHPRLTPTAPVDFGVRRLDKGSHTLGIVALHGHDIQFGLDYLQLEQWDGSRDPKPKKLYVTAGEFVNFYDRFNINDHCFIYGDDNLWHFYGIGGSMGFAHGTASHLHKTGWETRERPFPLSWNPWKEIHLWAPHIVKEGGLYYMFYCAGAKIGPVYRMHLATSPDLKTWTRHEENPLFIDGFDARDPMVLKVDDEWVMYYCANTDPRGGNHTVAYRKSKDLVHWGERGIAFIDPRRHKAGGGTESPFVVRRGDTYYLFIGPREGYVGTDIFASKDPFYWHLDDRVGHINSHAAEVVRDENGNWYVSHSGVGEGGLYLAPLHWNDGLDGAEASIPAAGK